MNNIKNIMSYEKGVHLVDVKCQILEATMHIMMKITDFWGNNKYYKTKSNILKEIAKIECQLSNGTSK